MRGLAPSSSIQRLCDLRVPYHSFVLWCFSDRVQAGLAHSTPSVASCWDAGEAREKGERAGGTEVCTGKLGSGSKSFWSKESRDTFSPERLPSNSGQTASCYLPTSVPGAFCQERDGRTSDDNPQVLLDSSFHLHIDFYSHFLISFSSDRFKYHIPGSGLLKSNALFPTYVKV